MRPTCTECGSYLLPCTVDGTNGKHPRVIDETTGLDIDAYREEAKRHSQRTHGLPAGHIWVEDID